MTKEIRLAKQKRRNQKIAFGVFQFTSYTVVGLLFVILSFIVIKGISVISWEFISAMPKEGMTQGGIFPAIVGTLCLVFGSMIFAFPVGVLAAIYMNEYVKDGWMKKIIKQMTNNLAGVPSIVFGLFGMALFVNKLEFGDSLLAGSLTLGLLVLPVVIRTTEESLKSVDDTFRQASLGLGASKWQTTSKVVFPIAFPNIITGLILSIGRVSGETAPILFTVAAYFLPKLPTSIFDQAMALPYHLYVISTSGTNIEASRAMAYGTALVLIIIVLISNLLANALRKYFGKKVKMN
ncbi:phosphate ABC transporter permease PstA [Flavobacterium yafengii]|jgi:phosphate transport system permease protein|uniref:Phosphate transport system permease protein PstA n=1 Tax=Flavobacterium yafengii TaxID=3041253 RepID=A0AAW6TN14_9FLAO|nr:phosphate ABC transporter permease PstA [Flavobacterium yafengii]MDI5896647.1 phosphate ABC transporter permease PstA [Flavobacterium yafengii]MDI5948740.1 phosphate ABC transporter permease PstA [Flavobacterium yafengii]MDI6045261.1 phosphate ABC transporter permease PstA [Flavobacterium yafengii]